MKQARSCRVTGEPVAPTLQVELAPRPAIPLRVHVESKPDNDARSRIVFGFSMRKQAGRVNALPVFAIGVNRKSDA